MESMNLNTSDNDCIMSNNDKLHSPSAHPTIHSSLVTSKPQMIQYMNS